MDTIEISSKDRKNSDHWMPVKDRMAIFTDSEGRDYDVNVLDVLEEEGKFVSCRVLTREGVIVMVKDIRFLREFSNDENNKSRFDETEDEGFVSIREDDEKVEENDDMMEEKTTESFRLNPSILCTKRRKNFPFNSVWIPQI